MHSVVHSSLLGQIMTMQDMCDQTNLVFFEKHDVLHTRCVINMPVVQDRDASTKPSTSAFATSATSTDFPDGEMLQDCQTQICVQQSTCVMANSVLKDVEHKTSSALLRLAQLRLLILGDLQHLSQPAHIGQDIFTTSITCCQWHAHSMANTMAFAYRH